MDKSNYKALLPIGVFMVFYLGLGILYEYILKIPMGFYNIPIVVAFMVSILVACLQNKNTFNVQLQLMAEGLGDRNIITMILIFMAAGMFVGVVGRSSAASVAYFILDMIPVQYSVSALFLISCFVSLAMGTSCGTITLIAPIAVSMAEAGGFNMALCLATVMGGAMFGDNLSFISDTTIAACNGQGCDMKDKFRENFKIALPATLVTLVLVQLMSNASQTGTVVCHEYSLLQILPYVLVLVLGIAGVNVFLVLLAGIIFGSVVMLLTGAIDAIHLLGNMGSGAAGMFETSMVAILVPAMCALIRDSGGISALLCGIKKCFRGQKGGQFGIGLLVSAVNVATANNTVAIVVSNPIAARMAAEYGIGRRQTASVLDIFSCVMQGIIPYGAQMLILLSVAAGMQHQLNAFQIMEYLYYPYMLFISVSAYILLSKNKEQ